MNFVCFSDNLFCRIRMSIRIIYYLLMNINEGKERIAPPPFYKIWLHETHLAPPSKLGEYSPCGHPNANTRRPSRSSSPFSSPACFHISHSLAILRNTHAGMEFCRQTQCHCGASIVPIWPAGKQRAPSLLFSSVGGRGRALRTILPHARFGVSHAQRGQRVPL